MASSRLAEWANFYANRFKCGKNICHSLERLRGYHRGDASHYSKHHKGYFDKLNGLIAGTDHAQKSLTELICSTDGAIFNNAAQAWNHILYWDSMSPNTHQTPSGELLNAIERDFGSLDALKKALNL